MEHIDNPMTMYFQGDEYNPQSPFYEEDIEQDSMEEDEDYKYELILENFRNAARTRLIY